MDAQPLPYETLILVCTNVKEAGEDACGGRNSALLRAALKAEVDARGLKGKVRVSATGCLGKCSLGPNIMVFPEGIWYSGVGGQDLPELIARHFQE